MSNVTFAYYAAQHDFETAQSTSTLVAGGLYFIADTHKIYRATAPNASVDFSEPFVVDSSFPSINSARIGCLYVNTTTHEVRIKTSSVSSDWTVVVPSLAKLTSVYTYKGSVADYASLPVTGNSNGDVYNVVAANGDTPAGTNYAYVASTGTWDPLGGSLSGYLSDSAKLEDLANVQTTTNELTSGDVLVYQEAQPSMDVEAGWYPSKISLDSLENVSNVGAAGLGDVLGYNTTSGKWEAVAPPLNTANTAITNPVSGQTLVYDSSLNNSNGGWKNDAPLKWTEIASSNS